MNKNFYNISNEDLIDETQYENEELYNTLNYLLEIFLNNIKTICKNDYLFLFKLSLFKEYYLENKLNVINLITKNIVDYENEIMNVNETFFLENKDKIDQTLSEILVNIWESKLTIRNKKLIWIQLINILILSKKYIE